MNDKKVIIEIIDDNTGIKMRGESSINNLENFYNRSGIDPIRVLFNKVLTEVNREISIRLTKVLMVSDMKDQCTFFEGTLIKKGFQSPFWSASDNLILRFLPTETQLFKGGTYLLDIESLEHLSKIYEILTNKKFK